jgi:hypothetical protein
MKKSELFRKLYASHCARENYLDGIPTDICSAIFDNKFVNLLYNDNSIMMQELFGEHQAAVDWFLHEWNPSLCAQKDDEEYYFANIEQYITYMKLNEGFE